MWSKRYEQAARREHPHRAAVTSLFTLRPSSSRRCRTARAVAMELRMASLARQEVLLRPAIGERVFTARVPAQLLDAVVLSVSLEGVEQRAVEVLELAVNLGQERAEPFWCVFLGLRHLVLPSSRRLSNFDAGIDLGSRQEVGPGRRKNCGKRGRRARTGAPRLAPAWATRSARHAGESPASASSKMASALQLESSRSSFGLSSARSRRRGPSKARASGSRSRSGSRSSCRPACASRARRVKAPASGSDCRFIGPHHRF